jgi:hypothetical protein
MPRRIQTCIVLPCKELDVFDLESAYDIARLAHTFSSLFGIIGCMRNITGEYDYIRLCFHAVHRCHGFFQGTCCIRVNMRITETPVRV